MKDRPFFGKALALTAALCLAAGALSGCRERPASAEGKLKIVCTIFPQYDWTRQILGDMAEYTDLVLLMKNGTDMHSYQPTVWDMAAVSDADLFIYVGGESDSWVEAALGNAKNPNLKALSLLEILEDSVLEEEQVEGMQAERGHDHGAASETGHEEEVPAAGETGGEESQATEEAREAAAGEAHENEGHSHEEEPEYDEHVWLSLKHAARSCQAITEALCELDGEHRAQYEKNEEAYIRRLNGLDQAYRETVDQSYCPVLLFGDRFPFRYLTEDYGITYYAAFAGCSAETEASFETITFLANKTAELSLPAVLTIDGSDGRIARTIAGNTRTGDRPEVLTLNSMQSVRESDMENGEDYLSIMEKNLEVLKEALPGTGR